MSILTKLIEKKDFNLNIFLTIKTNLGYIKTEKIDVVAKGIT